MAYEDSIDYLYRLQLHGIKLGLSNPTRLLAALGEPHRAFKSVHVAGTNGKGSTSAAMASMLSASGLRVGLFTSPHMASFTERIRIDGVEISPDDVASYTARVREAAEGIGLTPTFFEAVTAMAFLYFRERGVDWAVIETGMGGRLDATNVLTPAVSVITRIDYDHMRYLGGSLKEIAFEKAGIIKPGVPVVCAAQDDEAIAAISSRADEAGSALHLAGREFRSVLKAHEPGRVMFDYISDRGLDLAALQCPLSGSYQAGNMSLAVRAIEIIGACGERAVREGLASLTWPGRLEVIRHDPLVILDGAHNPAAAAATARAVREDFHLDGVALVFGAMADKDIEGMLRSLLPLASTVYLAPPEGGRAANAAQLGEIARRLGRADGVREFGGVALALTSAIELGMPVLVTGSFYLLGEAREALGSRSYHMGLRE